MHCSARSMCVLNIYAFPIGYHTERIGQRWSTLDQRLSFLCISTPVCLAQFCFYAHNVNLYMWRACIKAFCALSIQRCVHVSFVLRTHLPFMYGFYWAGIWKVQQKVPGGNAWKGITNTMPTLLAKAGAYVFHRAVLLYSFLGSRRNWLEFTYEDNTPGINCAQRIVASKLGQKKVKHPYSPINFNGVFCIETSELLNPNISDKVPCKMRTPVTQNRPNPDFQHPDGSRD